VLKLIVFSLVPALVLLGVAELGLRLYVAMKSDAEAARGLPPPEMRNAYQSLDPVLGFVLTAGYDHGGIRVNQLGFRGAEVSQQKPSGVLRIVAMGDSTTFGLAGHDCPYPAQLEARLSSTYGRSRVEVVNAGVEGYSVVYALRQYPKQIRELDPDIVTVYIGWNDLYRLNPFRSNEVSFHEAVSADNEARSDDVVSTKVARALNEIYLAQLLRRVIFLELPRLMAKHKPRSGPDVNIDGRMLDRYRAQMTELIDAIRADASTPVLMTLPSVLSASMSEKARSIVHYPEWANSDALLVLKVVDHFNDAIRGIARSEQVALVDNAAYVDSLGDKERLFFDTLHMYCEGYSLLAQNIQRELVAQQVLP
jgi:lysophospholipase L1-like esterase